MNPQTHTTNIDIGWRPELALMIARAPRCRLLEDLPALYNRTLTAIARAAEIVSTME